MLPGVKKCCALLLAVSCAAQHQQRSVRSLILNPTLWVRTNSGACLCNGRAALAQDDWLGWCALRVGSLPVLPVLPVH